MKVLIFINRLANKGGSERAAVVLANNFALDGFSVHIVSWMGGANSFFQLDPRVKVHALFQEDVSIYASYFQSLGRYHQAIKKIQPDTVIDVCTALSLLSVPLRLLHSYKLFSWEHFNVNQNWNAITPRLSRWMASKFATGVIALTENDRQHFEQRFGAKHAVCIPNQIAIQTLQKADLSQKRVLAIGRLYAQKGFDLLLESWQEIHSRFPDWKLRIVGEGELELEIKAQIDLLGLGSSVELYKPTLQIEQHYLAASVFVLSSRFEGLPLVLIEAQAMGLPLVSFNCETGPAEIIRHEQNGLLVEPLDTKGLAEAIARMIMHPELRQQFAQEGLKNTEKYKPATIFDKWRQLLAGS